MVIKYVNANVCTYAAQHTLTLRTHTMNWVYYTLCPVFYYSIFLLLFLFIKSEMFIHLIIKIIPCLYIANESTSSIAHMHIWSCVYASHLQHHFYELNSNFWHESSFSTDNPLSYVRYVYLILALHVTNLCTENYIFEYKFDRMCIRK